MDRLKERQTMVVTMDVHVHRTEEPITRDDVAGFIRHAMDAAETLARQRGGKGPYTIQDLTVYTREEFQQDVKGALAEWDGPSKRDQDIAEACQSVINALLNNTDTPADHSFAREKAIEHLENVLHGRVPTGT